MVMNRQIILKKHNQHSDLTHIKQCVQYTRRFCGFTASKPPELQTLIFDKKYKYLF